MTPRWEDSELDVITAQKLQAQKITDLSGDVDALAKAQRDAVRGIGDRIDGFRDACHTEVAAVHVEIRTLRGEFKTELAKFRAEVTEKDARREWTRPEKLSGLGLTLVFATSLVGLVLR